MDFDSPDGAKDFPGLYASESAKKGQSRDSDYSDDGKSTCKDLLGKKKEKKESKKDKGYKTFEGESSDDELDEARSPGKSKKIKTSFKFPGKDKKEKQHKVKGDIKDKKEEKEKDKVCKRDSKDIKKDLKDNEKVKVKKKKESKFLKLKDKKKRSDAGKEEDTGKEDKECTVKEDRERAEEKPVFGVPLQIAVERSKSHDGIDIPIVVRECIDYIEEHGLTCEGIYRTSGVKSKVRKLKSQYNEGEKVYLYEHEPHIVASLLKQFLRDLPVPILTLELTPKFEEAAALKNAKKRVESLQSLMLQLPNCNRLLLSWVFVHMLHILSMEKINKMSLQNVLLILSPTLQISHNILQALFAHSDVLFSNTELKKYYPPIDLDSSRLSLELPDSPLAIAEELNRQETFLNIIHAELNTGLRDSQKEEQLWEIQRIVTQLKRKLRFLKQVQKDSKSPIHPPFSRELHDERNMRDVAGISTVPKAPSSSVSSVVVPSDNLPSDRNLPTASNVSQNNVQHAIPHLPGERNASDLSHNSTITFRPNSLCELPSAKKTPVSSDISCNTALGSVPRAPSEFQKEKNPSVPLDISHKSTLNATNQSSGDLQIDGKNSNTSNIACDNALGDVSHVPPVLQSEKNASIVPDISPNLTHPSLCDLQKEGKTSVVSDILSQIAVHSIIHPPELQHEKDIPTKSDISHSTSLGSIGLVPNELKSERNTSDISLKTQDNTLPDSSYGPISENMSSTRPCIPTFQKPYSITSKSDPKTVSSVIQDQKEEKLQDSGKIDNSFIQAIPCAREIESLEKKICSSCECSLPKESEASSLCPRCKNRSKLTPAMDSKPLEDLDIDELIQKERQERFKKEELLLLREELLRKIEAEKLEISRLRLEVREYIRLRKYQQYSFDSTDYCSSTESEDSGSSHMDADEDTSEILKEFIEENNELVKNCAALTEVIMQERNDLLNVKVEMKMLTLPNFPYVH